MPNIISKYHQPRFVSSSLKREFSNPGKSKLINQQEFSRLNFIKINKNKLPKDFFPETAGSTGDSPAKRFDYANNEEELVTIRVRKT